MKNILMSLSLALLTTGAYANRDKITMKTVEIKNFQEPTKGIDVVGAGSGSSLPTDPVPSIPGIGFDRVGQVITIAKDIVALGEAVYTLVQKGKPSNTTDFAPISIVPKDPLTKEIVDPMDMENCSFPAEKRFATTVKTGGAEVVRFEYAVLYTFGCSYNGTGKFIQNAIVQPISVKTSYGWDFNATMKLGGIMNHGTKADPVVGAMLTIKYSMNSWRTAFERNDVIHITGKGELKSYSK